MVDNSHHLDATALQQDIKEIYDLALATFGDRAFAECTLFCRYLADAPTFDRNKRLVEKQIGRKIKLTGPLTGEHVVEAWKALGRFMPPSKRSMPNAIIVRRH